MVPARELLRMNMIEAYVAELGGALRGPRASKADLLAEARDGLIDAADAYEDAGLDRPDAERRAVAEFGAVPDIVPDYQTELGLAQGRRTALLIFFVLAAQPVLWRATRRLAGGAGFDSPGYLLVEDVVSWMGAATVCAAILVVAAAGYGVRYLGARRRLARVTGVFALTVCVVFSVLGVLLTALTPNALMSVAGLPSALVFLGIPLAGIGVSGRNCLTASGQPAAS
ncbi:permease prefix domain 1-containing protein [Micromonospora sp. WMMD882]|uniref:permease prefix domain 1-containing protein n=1 Tax=Micromonospora sp. WMMD882 TaxID=3015151 RepID=UPI00248D2373|nr:permease prefix domain 1-containing protein [Micromonospora sp. WMMD882]WBB81486.1 permease prefix domain 1-containing protein [Micromonospora sp. WMMD882]